MACDLEQLAEDSKCYQCLDSKQLLMFQAVLLYKISGSKQTVAELLEDGKCYSCLDDRQLRELIAILLCNILEV